MSLFTLPIAVTISKLQCVVMLRRVLMALHTWDSQLTGLMPTIGLPLPPLDPRIYKQSQCKVNNMEYGARVCCEGQKYNKVKKRQISSCRIDPSKAMVRDTTPYTFFKLLLAGIEPIVPCCCAVNLNYTEAGGPVFHHTKRDEFDF